MSWRQFSCVEIGVCQEELSRMAHEILSALHDIGLTTEGMFLSPGSKHLLAFSIEGLTVTIGKVRLMCEQKRTLSPNITVKISASTVSGKSSVMISRSTALCLPTLIITFNIVPFFL